MNSLLQRFRPAPMVAVALLASAIAGTGIASACDLGHYDVDGVEVYNDGRNTILEVFISPVEWDDWGDNLLGEAVIGPGDWFIVDLARYGEACEYDVLIVFETPRGMEEVDLWSVDLCEAGAIAADEWEVFAI